MAPLYVFCAGYASPFSKYRGRAAEGTGDPDISQKFVGRMGKDILHFAGPEAMIKKK
jgi:hypothetical protein